MNSTCGSGQSAQILWERSKESTNPTTTTEFPSSPEPPIKVSTCPLDSTISPCTCQMDPSEGANIECKGSAVNESSIATTFREIRRVNGIPEDRGIHINRFTVYETELAQLDLAPFYGSAIDVLYIQYNYNLTKCVTSGNPRDHGSIQVYNLDVFSFPLSRAGFGDTLKYFSNKMIWFSARGFNVNDDGEDDGEFLPGLSLHTNLYGLNIVDCGISGRLTSDTLIPKELQNLGWINLGYNSPIIEIGERAFDFEGRDDALEIHLQSNELNESAFHPNSGITRPGRQTLLELTFNQMTTLPFEIFEPFLQAHPQNVLWLYQNPLICDERVSWLKSQREEFQSRVSDAECRNDPGHTVFDSDLIP